MNTDNPNGAGANGANANPSAQTATRSDAEAIEIAGRLLKISGETMMSGDFDTFSKLFCLPQLMSVAETQVRIETLEDLQVIFNATHAHLKGIGVTHMHRTVEIAEFDGPDCIRSTHVSVLMSDDTQLQDPYPVVSRLVCSDEGWKVGTADYDIDPQSAHADALLRGKEAGAPKGRLAKKMTALRDLPNDPLALEIYQANLDAVSDVILNGPFEDALKHLRAPYYMRTTKGLQAYNNAQDIIDGIRSAQLSLRVQGASDYVRTAHHAYFKSANEIEGLHSTRILRGNELMTPAYENRMKLVRSADGLWKVIHAEHAVVMSGWPLFSKSGENTTLDDVDTLSQADEIARMVYQEYLDALTVSNRTNDFDAWVGLCHFPHIVNIDNVTRVIETPDEIRPFFDMISEQQSTNSKAVLKRASEFATFVNSHTIRGYHRTTMSDGTQDVFPAVRGRFTIALEDGQWRMTETVNSIANAEFPYITPIVSNELASEMDHKKDPTR